MKDTKKRKQKMGRHTNGKREVKAGKHKNESQKRKIYVIVRKSLNLYYMN